MASPEIKVKELNDLDVYVRNEDDLDIDDLIFDPEDRDKQSTK